MKQGWTVVRYSSGLPRTALASTAVQWGSTEFALPRVDDVDGDVDAGLACMTLNSAWARRTIILVAAPRLRERSRLMVAPGACCGCVGRRQSDLMGEFTFRDKSPQTGAGGQGDDGLRVVGTPSDGLRWWSMALLKVFDSILPSRITRSTFSAEILREAMPSLSVPADRLPRFRASLISPASSLPLGQSARANRPWTGCRRPGPAANAAPRHRQNYRYSAPPF